MFGSIVGLLAVTGCGTSDDGTGSTSAFSEVTKRAIARSFDTVASPRELAALSDLTVIGTIEKVAPGVDYFRKDWPEPESTVLLTVRVEDVLGGEGATKGETINVLLFRPLPVPVDAYRDALPDRQRAVFFLDTMPDLFGSDSDHTDFPKGLAEDAALFMPGSQGMILEDVAAKRLVPALIEAAEFPSGWDLQGTADALAAEVRAATPPSGVEPPTTDG